MAKREDLCHGCGDASGWVLETVIDHDSGYITSEKVPCTACSRETQPEPAAHNGHSGNSRRAASTPRESDRTSGGWLRKRIGRKTSKKTDNRTTVAN